MTDLSIYIKEGMKTVKHLLNQGDLSNANLLCQELVKVDPYNKKLLKLFKKIEEKILNQNLKIVKKEIDRTWNLWDEKRYEELLRIYYRLYEYAPQYGELHELIERAEKALGVEEQKKRRAFIAQALSAIHEILGKGDYEGVLSACDELLIVDPRNEKAQRLQKEAKEKLIEMKLKENERLIDSAEYERQIELFESLLKIDPQSEKVKKLEKDARQRLAEKKKIEARITVNEGMKRIKHLFEAQEYEKVIQACEDVLTWDRKNITARLYLKKAGRAIEEEIDERCLRVVREAFSKLREEYQRNKGAFTRI